MATVFYTTSFPLDQMSGVHNFASDTIKLALFGSTAALSLATTAYSTTGELSNGDGYTTGGATLSLTATYPKTESGRAATRFEDASWTFTGNKTVRYGLVYNSSQSNKAIMVFDFGIERTYTGSFEISFPLSNEALFTASTPNA